MKKNAGIGYIVQENVYSRQHSVEGVYLEIENITNILFHIRLIYQLNVFFRLNFIHTIG